jgi:hypothetical protein
MEVNDFLSRLDKVKSTGNGRWIACCPSHKDKSPSLSVRCLDDQRILVHCFAGCDIDSVLTSIGLELSDVMPPTTLGHKKSERIPFTSADALRCISFEAQVVAMIAINIAKVAQVSIEDKDRLLKANQRISGALQGAGL